MYLIKCDKCHAGVGSWQGCGRQVRLAGPWGACSGTAFLPVALGTPLADTALPPAGGDTQEARLPPGLEQTRLLQERRGGCWGAGSPGKEWLAVLLGELTQAVEQQQ